MIDQTSQFREKLRYALNLVEYDQAIFMRSQIERRIRQFFTISGRFKIKVDTPAGFRNSATQRGFSCLTRS